MALALDLAKYYANLLIYQYKNLPKAYNTVLTNVIPVVMPQQSLQKISFSLVPTSGYFTLFYQNVESPIIDWDDTAPMVQATLRALPGLSEVRVIGSFSLGFEVNFYGVEGISDLLIIGTNFLRRIEDEIIITITDETIDTLPLAVQNCFNIDTAIGVQLDILSKYTGVKRSAITTTESIFLNDDDYRTLIKFAIVQNNAGSSLAEIEKNLYLFFPNQFILTDYKNMHMSYLLDQDIGTENFFKVLVAEELIPRPMAVSITVIVTPDVTQFFGFRTYFKENPLVKPLNRYDSFNLNWFFLSYKDAILV